MGIKINKSFEEFINKLNLKFDSSIDSNSYDYDILKAFYNLDLEITNNINSFLDSLNFENKKGFELDNALEFFNLYRTKGNNDDIYEIKFSYTNNNPFVIKKDSILRIQDINYKVIKDEIITNSEKSSVYTQKTFSDYQFTSPIFSAGGIVCLDQINIDFQQEDIIPSQIIPKHLNLISIQRNVNEQETDIEFLEKSKSILQSYGYLNNEKIKNELMKDSRIKDLIFKNSNGITQIIVYPKELNKLNDIITYSQEVVNMFKSDNVQLLKPNINEISIDGISSQLIGAEEVNKIIYEITSSVKNYLSNILIDQKIIRSEIINIIRKIIEKLAPNANVNYSFINIYNSFFYRNNYDNPLEIMEVSDYIQIKENIITLGTIG